MKKRFQVLTLLIVIVLIVSACASSTGPSPSEDITGAVEVEDNDTAEHQGDDNDEDAESGHDNDSDSPSIDPAAIYMSKCSRCHGEDRSGGNGPALTPDQLAGDAVQYSNIISNGQGGMPSWSGKLSAGEINTLAEWILTTHE